MSDGDISLDLLLHTNGPVLEFGVGRWRDDPASMADWHQRLRDVVNDQDPWALLAMRPDGDVFVFDVTTYGIWNCSQWSTRVRLMFGPDGRLDDEMKGNT